MDTRDELEFVEIGGPRQQPDLERPPRHAAIVGLVVALLAGLAALTVAAPSSQPIDVGSPPEPRTTTSAAPPADDLAPGEIAGAGPILGLPVELEIWVGGDSPVTRIDLDTGNVLTLDRRAFPILATGVHLIVFDAAEDAFLAIDRRDPTARPLRLDVEESFAVDVVARGPADSTLWLADRSAADRVEWRLLSLETLAPVQSTSSESIVTARLPYRIEVAVAPVIDVRGPELHVLRPGGYEFWLDGRLVVHDGRRALVETCDNNGACRTGWYAIVSGEELPDPSPVALLELNELFGDWIHTKTPNSSESLLVDVVTGTVLDTQQRVRGRQFDISTDGRWGSFTGAQRLWMVDLSSGESIELPTVSNRVGTATSVVLTDRPVT